MNHIRILLIALVLLCKAASAEDYVTGPIEYQIDLSQSFSAYELTSEDKAWAQNLAEKRNYERDVFYFARTTLPLLINGKNVEGLVYQSTNDKNDFYVVEGDAILRIGSASPVSPGASGYSMISPESKKFIACFDCYFGGIPFLTGSEVIKGKVLWYGNEHRRL